MVSITQQLSSIAPWAALCVTLLIKLADYYTAEKQRHKTDARELTSESIKAGSSDIQFIISELSKERDKFNDYWMAEIERRRQVEDKVDQLRSQIFEWRAVSRELMLSPDLTDTQRRFLALLANDNDERETNEATATSQ